MDGSGDAWTFSIDKDTPGKVLDVVLAFFRPMMNFIRQVSEESWLGLAIIFMIFFTLFLIRMGARTGKGIAVYAEGLDYVGKRGLMASAALLGVLLAEWLLMPPLAVLYGALANTFSGGEPGLVQLLAFLASASPDRSAFLGEVAAFYGRGVTVLPLGWRTAGLVAVAFGSMVLVAKAASRFRSGLP